ncbi:MAG: hypothetical protein AAFY19_00340 [Pseudomonadota bacterium]
MAILGMAGGAIVWAVNELRKTRTEEVSRRDKLAEMELRYSERLERRVDRANKEIEALSRDLLESRLKLADAGSDPLDVVRLIIRTNDSGWMWAKKRIDEFTYEMVEVSMCYARDLLGGPPEKYVGNEDSVIFPTDSSDTFNYFDEVAYTEQRGIIAREAITDSPTGLKGICVSRKWPVRLPDGTDIIFGVGYLDGETPNAREMNLGDTDSDG